jgi:tetratricopeptide (TPR) repeat protein
VLTLRAKAHRALGMWSAAAEDLARIWNPGKDDSAAVASRAGAGSETLVLLVDSMLRAGNGAGARKLVDDAGESLRSDVRGLLELLLGVHEGSEEAAVARLKAAAPTPLVAELHLAGGRADDAVEVLRAVWKRQKGDPATARLLVLALLDGPHPPDDNLAEAKAVAASLAGDAPPGLAELLAGRILLAEADAAGAVGPLRAAQSALSSDPAAAAFYGDALFRTGERRDSLAALRRAAALAGASPGVARLAAARIVAASGEEKDPQAAERMAQEALRLDPASPDAADALAALLVARGAFRDAADVAERGYRAPGLTPQQAARLRYRAAVARFAGGEPAKARAIVDDLETGERDSALAKAVRGYSEIAAGRLDEADVELRAALAIDPTLAAAQTGRIEVALRRGDETAARRFAREYARARPDDAAFPLMASRLFVELGRSEAAESLLSDVLAARPDRPEAAKELATLLVASRRVAEAVAAYSPVVERAAPQRRLACELQLARIRMFDPAQLEAVLARARAIADSAAAEDALRREARTLQAESLLRLKRSAEAEVAALEVVKAWAGSGGAPYEERLVEARARFVLGTSAAASPRRQAEALDQLTRAHELDPRDHAITNNLAWLLSRRGETAAKGLDLARRATAAAPMFAGYWDTRAACAAAVGAFEESETSFQKALEIQERSAGADVEQRAATELRFAGFLRGRKREEEARSHASKVAEYARGTAAATLAESFLAR